MVAKVKDKCHDNDTISAQIFNKLCSDQPCPKLSTVRRNLFGIYDEKSKNAYDQSLDEKLSELSKKSSLVWNFDFLKELPQPGRYEWQRVRSYEVPVWYAATSRPSMKHVSQRIEDISESTSKNTFLLPESKTTFIFTASKDEKITTEQPSKKPRLVQTTMKDFSRVKKRRCSHRLKLKQVQLYSCKLRNHHDLPVHSRVVLV